MARHQAEFDAHGENTVDDSTASRPKVTVVVPCFNEESGLGPLIERLDAMQATLHDPWQFIFVDDGSTDATFARLLRAAALRPWITILRHEENLGLGAALRTGFRQARSPIVCTIDSDCTYPPERLVELVELVQDGADIATASAWHPASMRAQGSWFRIRLSRMVSSFYKALIGQDVYTFTCLFRAHRRELLDRIRFRSNGFAAVAELMLRALLSGATVAEVPMPLASRQYGESKLKIGDAVVAHVGLLTMTTALVGAQRIRRNYNSTTEKEAA
ncbi:MAG: glycosyltransferase family 2 protein [Candidatus Dadabacteria bacterium]|nr:MAG: glycosyltransferase family 2 protein [Candidatus Dadabacteria bacterium]